jgi:DNA polymerase III subunit delta'
MNATLRELSGSQPQAVAVLGAAVRGGRRHHAYILACPELEPTMALATAVAAALVCETPNDGDGCGTCSGCRKRAAGNHPDVLAVAPGEKGTITIEQVRDIVSRLGMHAVVARTKVVVVSRADAMNPAAQNALLKTLEEPPGATCFLLTAVRPRALLPTIRSRSQIVRLAPSDRLNAWKTLAAAGIPEELARSLGPLLGPDSERAQSALELTREVLGELTLVLGKGDAGRIAAAAADLGGDKERAELTLGLLEVLVRDALAKRHHAGAELLYGVPLEASTAELTSTAARLQELRRLGAYNLNRTLALETVLLALAGRLR